jgi:hypothetical protein
MNKKTLIKLLESLTFVSCGTSKKIGKRGDIRKLYIYNILYIGLVS